MKKFQTALIALLVIVSVLGLCSCSNNNATDIGYKTFDEITADGLYPLWMQPNTYIIYDENGVPEITEGGELTLKEASERDDIIAVGFTGDTKIEPNTKAEYASTDFCRISIISGPTVAITLNLPLRTKQPKNAALRLRFLFYPILFSAAVTVFFISIATVIGPTPPGTGVM